MSVEATATIRTNDVITVLDQYMGEARNLSYQRTKYAVKALSRFFRGKVTSDIDIPMCRQYVAFRMGENAAMSTAARELGTLRSACNHALKWRRITELEKPMFEIPTNLPRREVWLFKDELGEIINQASPLVKKFTLLAYETASRRRAIEQLEWSQCNFNRKTVSLSKVGAPKSAKRRPTVPMGRLLPLLTDMYAERANNWVLGSDSNLLNKFERELNNMGLLHVEDRDGRPAGKITPHILRHSRATHLLEDGTSIYAVAKLLGDTPETVQRTYGHICMSSLEDELAKSEHGFEYALV